jgi:hypothetical protein
MRVRVLFLFLGLFLPYISKLACRLMIPFFPSFFLFEVTQKILITDQIYQIPSSLLEVPSQNGTDFIESHEPFERIMTQAILEGKLQEINQETAQIILSIRQRKIRWKEMAKMSQWTPV